MQRFDFEERVIPREVFGRLPKSVAERDAVIPVETDEDGTLVVATSDPTDNKVRDKLSYLFDNKVRFAFAPRAEIAAAVSKYYTP